MLGSPVLGGPPLGRVLDSSFAHETFVLLVAGDGDGCRAEVPDRPRTPFFKPRKTPTHGKSFGHRASAIADDSFRSQVLTRVKKPLTPMPLQTRELNQHTGPTPRNARSARGYARPLPRR